MTARALAASLGYVIGCGDNSCWFGRHGPHRALGVGLVEAGVAHEVGTR